jgi:hypothetical protein
MTQSAGFFEDHRGSETPEQTHDNRHQYQDRATGRSSSQASGRFGYVIVSAVMRGEGQGCDHHLMRFQTTIMNESFMTDRSIVTART